MCNLMCKRLKNTHLTVQNNTNKMCKKITRL